MYNKKDIDRAFKCIADEMTLNKDYLIELDQQNGDGDLGISMSNGFLEAYNVIVSQGDDIGKAIFKAALAFNEKAPSSLGTIMSFGMIGIGKYLKGKTEVSIEDLALGFKEFNAEIMAKGGAKRGEKTILDSLLPAQDYIMDNYKILSPKELLSGAVLEAKTGSEKTKEMKSVHGRAAYYGDKSIGLLDGGSHVGYLLFKSLENL